MFFRHGGAAHKDWAARLKLATVMRLLKSSLIPLSLFSFNILLHLYLISKGPYHLDCVTMAYQAQQTLKTGTLHYLHSHGFPLSAVIAAASVWLGQALFHCDAVTAVNGMSACVSALSVPLFYIISKKLAGQTAAIISSLLFSLSPIFLSLSVFGNTHVLSLFFCLLTVSMILHIQKPPLSGALATGAALGLWGAVRLQDALTLLPALLLLMRRSPPPKEPVPGKSWRFRAATACLTATVITGLFYLPLGSGASGAALQNFLGFEITSRIDMLSVKYLLLSLIYLADNFLLLGVILAALGHMILHRKDKPLFLMLVSWYAVPLCVFSRLDIVMPRFFLCALPSLYIMAGTALATLYAQRPGYYKILSVLTAVLWAWMCFYRILPVLEYRHHYALLPDYVGWLNARAAPDAMMIPGDEGNFLRYYNGPEPLSLPLRIRTPYSAADLDFMKDRIDGALAEGHEVYINYITISAYNPGKQFTDFLKRNYSLVWVGEKLYEDWHRGAIYQFIYPVAVYRIVNE